MQNSEQNTQKCIFYLSFPKKITLSQISNYLLILTSLSSNTKYKKYIYLYQPSYGSEHAFPLWDIIKTSGTSKMKRMNKRTTDAILSAYPKE